jgi:hypothetical protein
MEVAFEESFLFLSADLAIPPSTNDSKEIGTTFIYEPSPVFDDNEFITNGTPVQQEDSQLTGVCTRTSSTLDGDVGGGNCQFDIEVDGSSITFGGFIEDYVAGTPPPTLVITGGSGDNTGIKGEVALLPLDGNGDEFTGDIFFDAFGYQASISGIILVCEMTDGSRTPPASPSLAPPGSDVPSVVPTDAPSIVPTVSPPDLDIAPPGL